MSKNIPLRTNAIAAFIARIESGTSHWLILRRRGPHLADTWQMVSGGLEPGETAIAAALREIREETGLVPDRLYATERVECFYDARKNRLNLFPIFFARLDADRPVRLSSEHTEARWIRAEEAANYLSFAHQVEHLHALEAQFVQRKPLPFLEIDRAAW